MKNLFLHALTASLCTLVAPLAHSTVLTFEDRPASAAFFLADYHGFTFGTNSLATTAWFSTGVVNAGYAPSSGSNYISTDFQLYAPGLASEPTQAITSAVDFVFDGAFFTGFDGIFYNLYNDGILVHTSANTFIDATPRFVGSGYAGAVDEVVVYGRQGYYALDDFTFHAVANSVPEPGSFALLGLGLAGLVATRRRQRG